MEEQVVEESAPDDFSFQEDEPLQQSTLQEVSLDDTPLSSSPVPDEVPFGLTNEEQVIRKL